MFAVTGATGQLGRKVISSLKKVAAPEEIVAIVRDPAKAADLGVIARQGDYGDVASMTAALNGVTKLLLISSSSLEGRQEEHANVIAAARAADVGHIIYTSLLHADRWEAAFAHDHVVTEKAILKSGLAYTILRNGWYWENHTAGIAPSLSHGAMVGSAGNARISWASRQDYADAAVAILTGLGHKGRIYELAGDTSATLADLAAEVAHQTGKPFAYHNLSEVEHAAFYEQVGLPAFVAKVLANVEGQGVASGVLEDAGGVLSRLIGRKTTSMADAVAVALKG